MKNIKYIFALFIIALISQQSKAYDMDRNPDIMPDEGIFQVKYDRVVKSSLTALFFQDSLYVSVNEIMSLLQVDYDYDTRSRILSGYFIHPDSVYELDFSRNTGNMVEREVNFDSLSYITNQLQVFITPQLILRIFGIDLNINNNNLTLSIVSSKELPVLSNFTRNNRYKSLGEINNGNEYYPLRFDRDWHWLNGGFLDYDVRYTKSRYYKYVNYTANLGLEVLGGEFALSNYGSYTSTGINNLLNYNFHWKYFLGDNDWLKTLTVGNLSTTGSAGRSGFSTGFEGIQLSNNPIINPIYFRDYNVNGYTTPGNDVELYINKELADHVKADSTGLYDFTFPLNYGRLYYSVKSYDKMGLVSDETYRLNAPYILLKPGEIRYTLNAGRKQVDKKAVFGGIVSAGITNWLTNSVTVEKHQNKRELIVIDKLSMNLFNNLFAEVNYFHNDNITADMTYNIADLIDLDGSYMKNLSKSNLPRSIMESYTMNVGFSSLFGLPFNFSVAGRRDYFQDFINNQYNARFFASFGDLRFSTYYTLGFTEGIDFGSAKKEDLQSALTYTLPAAFKAILLDRTRLSLASSYSLISNNLTSISAGFSKNLWGNLNFNINYGYRPVTKTSVVIAGLALTLNPFKSTSRLTYSENALSYYEGLRGAVGFDTEEGSFYFKNSRQIQGVGYGSAVIRYFMDSNLDNIYEENEMLLPDVKVRVPQANVSREKNSPDNLAFNVPSYGRLNVTLDKESLRNPLWTPVMSDFSFVSDPSCFKHIDIPCYASGVIEGSVYRNDSTTKKALPGIKVVVLSTDSSSFKESITCFSDGNFYYMGIPPGNYKAEIDSTQLVKLGLTPAPAFIEFTVKRTTDGDFISDLVFELTPINANKPQTNKKDE